MAEHRLRVGIIGFGLAGGLLHAPVIAAVPRLRITAIATSRAAAVRERFPDVAVVADPDALLADPGIDLVVIATPNDTHASLARAALLAGKHVVVDKPLVTHPADGADLIRLAGDRGRMLTVYHNRRWDGDFLTVEKLVRGGRLGEIRLAQFSWDRLRAAIKPGWREVPGDGGGLLADLGPHLIDQALRLFGMPDAITADIVAQRDAARVDDYFDLTLHHGRGRVLLSASTLVAAPRPRFALHGTAASFVKYGIDPQEAVLRGGGSPGQAGFGEETPEAFGTLTHADGKTEPVPTEPGNWTRFYDQVAAAILDDALAPVDPADALAGLRLIALARQSAAEGRTLPI